MILRRALPRQANRIVIAALLDAGGGAPVAGDAAATIGAITASGAGSVGVNGAGAATIGAVEAAGSGTLGAAVVGSGAATLGSLTAAGSGSVSANGTAAATLGALAAAAAGSAAIVGTGAATIGALTAASQAYVLVGACVGGVLVQSPTNGRYFQRSGDGKIVPQIGFHTWYNLCDGGASSPPPAFGWATYLAALVAYGVNSIRGWIMETAEQWPTDPTQKFAPSPWLRTGPGLANDGGLKFDLTKPNPVYFERLRERVIEAGNAGIYVSVMLFNGFHIDNTKYGGSPTGDPWHYHPFNSANNINSVNGDIDGDGIGDDARSTTNTAAYNAQLAYVEHVIDVLNSLDNVSYEIENEGGTYSAAWQNAIIDHIHTYEAGKAKQHPVGFTKIYPGGSNATLTSSNADWYSPDEDLTPAAITSTAKVAVYDTDHTAGITNTRAWAWIALCQGFGGLWYMDLWDSGAGGEPNTINDATYMQIRRTLGWALAYADRIDLAHATPQGALSSTGYALAKTTGAYQVLAYQAGSGAFTVDLTSMPGTFTVEWRRVANSAGTVQSGSNVSGGAVRTLTPPWVGEDVIAFLELAGYSGTAAATIGGLTASGAGSVAVNGAGAATIGAVVAVAVGVVDVTGADQAVVGALVAAAAGSVAVNGAGAAVVGAVEAASAGSVAVDGDAAATIGALEAAGAGTTSSGSVSGGAATVIGDIAAVGVGSAGVNGAAAALVGAIVAGSVVAVAVNGAGAADLGTFEASGFGGSGAGGAALATIGDIVAAGAGSVAVNGAALATIGDVVAAGAGAVPVSGVGLATVGELVAAGVASVAVIADGSAVIGAIVASGSGALTDLPEIHGAAAVTIGAITASGAGVVAWILAVGRIAGPGVPGVVSGPKSSIGE